MRLVFFTFCLIFISAERLTADIYIESLCPYCINFIKNSLLQAINTPEIEKMVHIRLIPYGNTKRKVVNDKWVFTCQHGETECYGDLIELCVQNRVSEAFAPNNEIPLVSAIHCIENKVFKPYTNQQFDQAAKACAINYKYDAADVITCANSEEGYKYHLQAAEETDRLSPPHLGVPWAVANRNYQDATADAILEDLVQWACDNYTGQKIDACNNKMQ